jgi:hypothetical protein
MALNGSTPADKAAIEVRGKDKWLTKMYSEERPFSIDFMSLLIVGAIFLIGFVITFLAFLKAYGRDDIRGRESAFHIFLRISIGLVLSCPKISKPT